MQDMRITGGSPPPPISGENVEGESSLPPLPPRPLTPQNSHEWLEKFNHCIEWVHRHLNDPRARGAIDAFAHFLNDPGGAFSDSNVKATVNIIRAALKIVPGSKQDHALMDCAGFIRNIPHEHDWRAVITDMANAYIAFHRFYPFKEEAKEV